MRDQPLEPLQQCPRRRDAVAGDLPVADQPIRMQPMSAIDDDRRPGAENDSDLGDDRQRDVAARAAARLEIQIAHQRGQPGDVFFLAAPGVFTSRPVDRADAKERVDGVGQLGGCGDRLGER